jgi:hypothetical protein
MDFRRPGRKMVEFLWIGTSLGTVLGVLHGISVFRQQSALAGGGHGRALYFALWTLALWAVFGAYVLAFWLLGAFGLALSRLGKWAETSR